MLFILHCLMLLHVVFGGTHCPPRDEIRPCICINRKISKKKMETTVICHNLADDKSIEAIHPALTQMEIDKFLLYDSFWKMEPKKPTDSAKAVNIFNSYRLNEIDIVDTPMTHFGCPMETTCGTSYLKRLTSINSTLNEKQSCNTVGLTINSWVSCPSSVEYLEINNGIQQEFTLKPEFFPQPMSKLKELHLTNNKVGRIDRRTFNSIKFPVLHTLNLSYNNIRDMKQVFLVPMKIKHLDLRNNNIRGALEFGNLPQLKTLILANNFIASFLENDWALAPPGLRHLDLSNNDFKCECAGFRWINSTFHINMNLLGACSNPNELRGMTLRKASRTLSKRCEEKKIVVQ